MPVVAANNAPTNTTEIPNPPRTGPNRLDMVNSKSSAILERCNMIPIKMNNGIAISVSRSGSQ